MKTAFPGEESPLFGEESENGWASPRQLPKNATRARGENHFVIGPVAHLPAHAYSSAGHRSVALLFPALWPSLSPLISVVVVKSIVQLLSCPNLCWKRIWLINIDYSPPTASKNWLLGSLIWMHFSLLISCEKERGREGKRSSERIEGIFKQSNFWGPWWGTFMVCWSLDLSHSPSAWPFFSVTSNCHKSSLCPFGPCSQLPTLLREERWYWFWMAGENAREY